MTFANAGTIGCQPGRRDELIALLTARNDVLTQLGCLLYEVGTSEAQPDTVFVVELWTSAEHHARSLEHPDVRSVLAEARPLLSGTFGGFRFEVAGSPLAA